MKSFTFSLQKLLDTKSAFEKESEARLAAQLGNLDLLKKEMSKLDNKIEKELESSRKSQKKTNSRELSLHATYLSWLNSEKSQLQMSMSDICTQIDETRARLTEIVRERKTLENLMKREKQQWLLDAKHEESFQMDEFAAGHFIRRRKTA